MLMRTFGNVNTKYKCLVLFRAAITIRLGCPELKEDVDLVVALELRQAQVGLLIVERQRVVQHQRVVRVLGLQEGARHGEVWPPAALQLIEVVVAVEDELLDVAIKVLDGRNERVSRQNSSDVKPGVVEKAVRAKDLSWKVS